MSSDDVHSSPANQLTISLYQNVIADFINLINRDFIQSWFSKVSPEPIVSNKIESSLHFLAYEITKRVERVDFIQLIISKLVPCITMHIIEYRRAERLLRAERLQRNITDPNELDYLLARCYRSGKLHPALHTLNQPTLQTELIHLRKLVKQIIPLLLPKSERDSKIMQVLVREILVSKVFQPLMEILSDPDTWNQIFESMADQMIPEETFLAKKINDILGRDERDKSDEERLESELNRPPSFDEYIKAIKDCDNLLDALRIKDTINLEIQKKKDDIAGLEVDEVVNGLIVGDIRTYINRLSVAQKGIDKRIKALGGKTLKIPVSELPRKHPMLISILENPHLLAAFAEYMDIEGRLPYLQFWMTSFGIQEQLSQLISKDEEKWLDEPDTSAIENARNIYKTFFITNNTFIDMDEKLLLELQDCFRNLENLDVDEMYSLRWLKLLKKAQNVILCQMELTDYSQFLKSKYYSKSCEQIFCGEIDESIDEKKFHPTYLDKSKQNADDDHRSMLNFKVPNVFKRMRRASFNSVGVDNEIARNPSRKDESENVEGELKELIDEKSFGKFFLRKKKTEEKVLDHERGGFLNRFRKRSPARNTRSLHTLANLKNEYENISSDESDIELSQSHRYPTKAEHPSITVSLENISDSTYSQMLEIINEKKCQYEKLELELNHIETSISEIADQTSLDYRNLYLMKKGLEAELHKLKTEIIESHERQLDYIISPNHIQISIEETQTVQGDIKSYTIYPIQIQATKIDSSLKWTVVRRYSEFEQLHQKLKSIFPSVSHCEFPGKLFKGILQMKKQMIETRRLGLEKYLMAIISDPNVAKSAEIKNFLLPDEVSHMIKDSENNDASDKKSFMKSLFSLEYPFKRIKSSDIFNSPLTYLKASPLSIKTGSKSAISSPKSDHSDSFSEYTWSAPLSSASARDQNLQSASATDTFIDLFIELFELKERNNWLRRQAIVLLLQSLFGGTVDRKITENLNFLGELESTVKLLETIREYLWPKGEPIFQTVFPNRTFEQKKKTKQDSHSKIMHLFPEILGAMVGKFNAKRGGERLCLIFQNRRLNQHFSYILFDEFFASLFPEENFSP